MTKDKSKCCSATVAAHLMSMKHSLSKEKVSVCKWFYFCNVITFSQQASRHVTVGRAQVWVIRICESILLLQFQGLVLYMLIDCHEGDWRTVITITKQLRLSSCNKISAMRMALDNRIYYCMIRRHYTKPTAMVNVIFWQSCLIIVSGHGTANSYDKFTARVFRRAGKGEAVDSDGNTDWRCLVD